MHRVTLNATLQTGKPGSETPIRGLAESDSSSIAVTRHIRLIRPGVAARAPGYAITHIQSCKTIYHHPKALHRAYRALCPLVEYAGDWYAGLVHNEYLQALFAAFETTHDSPDAMDAALEDAYNAHLHKFARHNRAPFLRDPYIALSDRDLPADIPPYDPAEAMRLYDQLPTDHALANPTMDAIRLRGGSATAAQIRRYIINTLGIPQDAARLRIGDATELDRRLEWVRSGLQRYGVIHAPAKGVWALTRWGKSARPIDPQDVSGYILAQNELEYLESQRPIRRFPYHDPTHAITAEMRDILQPLGVIYGDKSPISRSSSDADDWQPILRRALLSMSPNAFVSLLSRLLMEYQNIDHVEITRKTRHGFQGVLMARFQEMGSDPIPTPFRLTRGGSRQLNAGDIREFRFSLSDPDRVAILLTTADLSESARREARSGSPRILLIDGDALMNRLRHLGWGIQTTPEFTDIDTYYYANYHLIY